MYQETSNIELKRELTDVVKVKLLHFQIRWMAQF